MTDDLRELLRSAAGPPARPDHADIRRRGRRLAVVRTLSVVGIAAVVAAGAVAVALGLGGEDLARPIIGEPPPAPVEAVEEAEEPADEAIEGPPLEPVGEVCVAPDLRPTYLPWLEDGEEVPAPTHQHHGTNDEPNGRLVWAEDQDAYDPTGYSETHTVSISALAEHQPSGLTDLPDVDVRGYPAELVWVGDPGIGQLSLTWSERPGPCGTFAAHLLITTRPEVPDYLDLERPFADAEAADGVDAAILELEQAIEAEILRIADSLVEADSAVPEEEVEEAAPTITCRDDGERRNAPPTDGSPAHLYLPCDGADHDPRVPVYRLDTDLELTDDIARDSAALLEELLEGPTEEQRARDFYGPADGQAISVNSVTFDGGLMVVDLHFDEGGVDNLNTAAASAVWHVSLQGTLFQFPEVERLELRLDGSCEGYLEHFQSSGCEQLHRSGAPWAAD